MRFGSSPNTIPESSCNSGGNSFQHYPRWRTPDPARFRDGKEFHNHTKSFSRDDKNRPWRQTPITQPNEILDPYKDGVEKRGELLIGRDVFRTNGVPFQHFTRSDIWNSVIDTSQTMRTFKSDKLHKVKPIYDSYSKNPTVLPEYKRSLIKTGNVDHIIPFRGSNSSTGMKRLPLRPTYPKTYPQSAINMLANAYFGILDQQKGEKLASSLQFKINQNSENKQLHLIVEDQGEESRFEGSPLSRLGASINGNIRRKSMFRKRSISKSKDGIDKKEVDETINMYFNS